MVLGLLRNIPILNSFVNKKENPDQKAETEATANIKNEEALIQEGLKPLFIVALPEGDFSELKTKLKEKFSGRDLHFELDPELKKPKLYIIKPNALAKRNLETALDKAFIKENYKSIELSGDGSKLGESLLRTMNTEFSYLKGAERKIEYTQKEAEKAKLRQSLESLSKMGVHVHGDGCGCGETHDSELTITDQERIKAQQTLSQIHINKERRKSLIDFFSALKQSKESEHTKFIEKNSEVYILRDPRKNLDVEFDVEKCTLIIAKKTDNNRFDIHEMNLIDFMKGNSLPLKSRTMTIPEVHQASHAKAGELGPLKAEPALVVLSNPTNLTEEVKTQLREALQEQLKEQLERQLKSSAGQIRTYIKKPEQKSVPPLIKLNGFSTGLQQQGEEFRVKNLATNIKKLFQAISSPTNQEQFKNLDGKIAQEYRDTRIRIAKELDVEELLNASITDKDSSEAETEKESILAQLEQSDPISQEINRDLAKRDDFKNSTDPETGKEEHDKQVGGIALTGQFSFIDRKEYHEKNKTYEHFPPLPDSWKTESNSLKPNTQETQMNNPVNSTQQATAGAAETSTETATPHAETAVNNQNEPVKLAAAEIT
jgi:hypothetical protein